MLPKVATHLLHTTTRSAAAAVHGQTSTLRNVLQGGAAGPTGAGASSKPTAGAKPAKPVTIALVTASGSTLGSSYHNASTAGANPGANAGAEDPSAGSSGQQHSGSGPRGSAKNGSNNPKAGRRYYTNYNSASRAVTQANAIMVPEDVPTYQSSTSDEINFAASTQESRRALLKASSKKNASAQQKRSRLRSSSVNTLLPRNEKEKDGAVMEKISVLKTVQLQARSLHVLSAAATKSAAAPSDSVSASSPAQPQEQDSTAELASLTVEEVVAPTPVPAASAAAAAAPRPQTPRSTSPRAASPVSLRRRNSTSSISRPSSPLLFAEEPAEVHVHLARRSSTVASPPTDSAAAPASPSSSSMSSSASASDASDAAVSETSSATSASSPRQRRQSFSSRPSSPASQQKPRRVFANRTPTKYSVDILAANNEVACITAVQKLLEAAHKSGHPFTPADHVQPTVADFNNALARLSFYRREGETIASILDVYTTMLQLGARQSEIPGFPPRDVVKPSPNTYTTLIELFTLRDLECQRMLVALNHRARNRHVDHLVGAPDTSRIDQQRIEWVTSEAEGHFSNAVKLFEALLEVGGRDVLSDKTYKALLKSAAAHGNIKVALLVFGHMEKKLLGMEHSETGAPRAPDSEVYRLLIQAFTNHGDYDGAELIFKNFKESWDQGKIWFGGDPFRLKSMQVQVWNQMMEMYFRKGEPEKAVDLLDSMLKASAAPAEAVQSSPESTATPPSVPSPGTSSFTAIIGGFIKMGDVQTAYSWFKRLLQETDMPAVNPFKGAAAGRAMKPDQVAWTLMLDALASEGMLTELNSAFATLVNGTSTPQFKSLAPPADDAEAVSDEPMSLEGVRLLKIYRHIVLLANLEWMKAEQTWAPGSEDRELALQRLDFIRDHAVWPVRTYKANEMKEANAHFKTKRIMVEHISSMYILHGEFAKALDVFEGLLAEFKSVIQHPSLIDSVENVALAFWDQCLQTLAAQNGYAHGWNWQLASRFAMISTQVLGLKVTPQQAVWLVHTFGQAVRSGELADVVVPVEVFRLLLGCSVHVDHALAQSFALVHESGIAEFQSLGTAQLLQEMSRRGIAFDDAVADAMTRLSAIELAVRVIDPEQSRAFFAELGPTYLQAFEQQSATRYEVFKEQLEEVAPSSSVQVQERIDVVAPQVRQVEQQAGLSREIDSILKNPHITPEERAEQTFGLFKQSYEAKNQVPHIPTIGRVIQACGRLNMLDHVREAYTIANSILASLEDKMGETKRRSLWAHIEDAMIIALAHAGDIEGAHVHRQRILQHSTTNDPKVRLAPSADAYGALILYVKDTTDDASNAFTLWNEAMSLGVTPNLYLFNNIISKLSRARKADSALELFYLMREQGLVPSSITYGAVIGACARVGDVISAETLFKEMTEQTNFKPRVPPFNTMMQVYTTTKPNRERALWYYEEMLKSGVQPTAHTYKLLLDAYGSVEPVDIPAMEKVFQQLKQDRRVQVQGTHFASLINAYGCVLRNLDKAIAIFEEIPTYQVNGKPLVPDAVVYEAMVNVVVANKQTSLLPTLMERMAQDQVHMTAYVANFLIKGYANVGDIEQARGIFEGMMDPPTGVAAPNNHLPHDPAVANENISVMDPVYREPSTWEAMIRAELGVGNRNRAYELLERLKVRQYPEAVFNRISGVLVDHSAVVIP